MKKWTSKVAHNHHNFFSVLPTGPKPAQFCSKEIAHRATYVNDFGAKGCKTHRCGTAWSRHNMLLFSSTGCSTLKCFFEIQSDR